MDLSSYHAFTESLVASLTARDGVLGLVAVGSMASGPDEFSDHDFLVIAAPAATEGLRRDVTWLPGSDRLVLVFRETEHGVKAVYDDGHVVELAVFTPDQIALARVNRYEVLIDGGNLRDRMAAAARASAESAGSPEESDAWLVGQLLTAVLVGVPRHRGGVMVAGADFVPRPALPHFLGLLARPGPPPHPAARDDLNPFRRVERAWPAVGLALTALFATGNLERTALGMLDLGSDLFVPHLSDAASPEGAWTAVRGYLTTR